MNRQHKIWLLLLFVLGSCGQTEHKESTHSINIEAADPLNSYFELSNTSGKTVSFFLEINEKGVYDIDKMVYFINARYKNMPCGEKVWRFISEYTRHKSIISRNNWLYNPLILVNSAGGSLCGFRSAAMTNILLYMGVKARSWCINGHVVTEVYENGRWQVYDPDLGVVYYNEKGNICSYNELCNNPLYITRPVKVRWVSTYCDSITACSQKIADMYTSLKDNLLFSTYFENADNKQQLKFILPPHAKIAFPVPDNSDTTAFACAELQIPRAWTGIIKMQLIPFSYSGNALISYRNKPMPPNSSDWYDAVYSSEKFDNEIDIRKNPDGVTFNYYINPYLFRPEKRNTIKLEGNDVDSIEVYIKRYGHSIHPDWDDYCGQDFVKWVDHIAACSAADHISLRSYHDYLKKIRLLDDCGVFKSMGVDTRNFYAQMELISKKFSMKDAAYWRQFENRIFFVRSLNEILKTMQNGNGQ